MRSRVLPLLLLSAALRAESPALLERVLAVVNGRPILLSSVRLLSRVKGLDSKASLEAAIDERLMAEEASQLPQALVSGDEEERGYLSLLSKLGGLPEDVGEGDLRRLVRREMTILKYVDFRFRTEVRVSDADVQKAYEAAYGNLPGAPAHAEADVALRTGLEDKQVGEAVEVWVKELRSAAEIRYQGSVPPP
jgi:hypothetical protein